MNSMQFFYLDCYLPVQNEVLATAFSLNEILVEKFASSINFKQKIEPHLTVFMGLFPDYSPVQAAMQVVNAEFFPISLEFSKIRLSSDGYVFWDAVNHEKLQALHEKVVEKLNPLRQGLTRDKFLLEKEKFTHAERENIEKYGFPWVMNLFMPHLTLGRLPTNHIESKTEEFLHKLQQSLFCPVESLALGQVGENGTVRSLFSD